MHSSKFKLILLQNYCGRIDAPFLITFASEVLIDCRFLHNGGSQLTDWVSEIFFGPSVRTIQRIREESQLPLRLGTSLEHVDVAHKLLKDYGLKDVPFIVSEDGTAQQVRADIMQVNGELRVFGFNGETVTVRTAQYHPTCSSQCTPRT